MRLFAGTSASVASATTLISALIPAAVSQHLHSPQTPSTITKRASPAVIPAKAWAYYGAYFVNTTLGTPGQPVSLCLDVSADTHKVSFNCANDGNNFCEKFGYFDSDRSETFAYGEVFSTPVAGENITLYGDLSDMLAFVLDDGSTMEKRVNVSIEAAWEHNDFNTLAASSNSSSILDSLVKAGLIDTRSFSLWNNPAVDDEAEVLFGGVNTAHYTGSLHTHSIKDSGIPSLPVSGIRVSSGSADDTSSDIEFSATRFQIQTNGYFTSLPADWRTKLYTDLNIPSDREIDCSRRAENHTISLAIGNATISAPWENFFYVVGEEDDDDKVCFFTAYAVTDEEEPGIPIIGSEFVKNLFLAVDYEDMMVGFAKLNTRPGEGEVLSLMQAAGVQGQTEGSTGDGDEEEGSTDEEENPTDGAGRAVPGLLGVVGGVVLAFLLY